MDLTELGFKISYHIKGIVDKYFEANKKLGLDCSILNFQIFNFLDIYWMGVQNLQYYKGPANCRFTNDKTVTRESWTRSSPAKPCQAKKKVMMIQAGWFKVVTISNQSN